MDYEIREIDRTALKAGGRGSEGKGGVSGFFFSLGFPFAFLHSIQLFLLSTLIPCYASTRLVQSSAAEDVDEEETLRG